LRACATIPVSSLPHRGVRASRSDPYLFNDIGGGQCRCSHAGEELVVCAQKEIIYMTLLAGFGDDQTWAACDLLRKSHVSES
jgi:hypothetical protein